MGPLGAYGWLSKTWKTARLGGVEAASWTATGEDLIGKLWWNQSLHVEDSWLAFMAWNCRDPPHACEPMEWGGMITNGCTGDLYIFPSGVPEGDYLVRIGAHDGVLRADDVLIRVEVLPAL